MVPKSTSEASGATTVCCRRCAPRELGERPKVGGCEGRSQSSPPRGVPRRGCVASRVLCHGRPCRRCGIADSGEPRSCRSLRDPGRHPEHHQCSCLIDHGERGVEPSQCCHEHRDLCRPGGDLEVLHRLCSWPRAPVPGGGSPHADTGEERPDSRVWRRRRKDPADHGAHRAWWHDQDAGRVHL